VITAYAPLPEHFYARPAAVVAPALLGTLLVARHGAELTVGRIVETEAYTGPDDPASHAAARIGRTRRNATMFGAPGLAYVYRSYGIHWCLNVVTDEPGFPGAVLIRAIEPLEGLDIMRRRRWPAGEPGRDRDLGSGPGRLAVAMGVKGEHDAHSLGTPPLWIAPGETPPARAIASGPRIGITRAADWPLRFLLAGNPHVSR
jgi:DNA-3-methyladenine glycosylase